MYNNDGSSFFTGLIIKLRSMNYRVINEVTYGDGQECYCLISDDSGMPLSLLLEYDNETSVCSVYHLLDGAGKHTISTETFAVDDIDITRIANSITDAHKGIAISAPSVILTRGLAEYLCYTEQQCYTDFLGTHHEIFNTIGVAYPDLKEEFKWKKAVEK